MRRPRTPDSMVARVSVPASTSSSAAFSVMLNVIGPGASWLKEIGTTPSVGTRPTVGFIKTRTHAADGAVIEPLVSVPTANGASRAAIAAPLPELEPQAVRLRAYGLRVSPPWALHPDVACSSRMLAHSLRLVLPSTTMPASRSRRTRIASWAGGSSARASEPALEASPAVSTLSLTRTARPCSGERRRPASVSRSSVSASASAWLFTALTDRSWWSTSSTRPSSRRTSSWAGPVVTSRSWQVPVPGSRTVAEALGQRAQEPSDDTAHLPVRRVLSGPVQLLVGDGLVDQVGERGELEGAVHVGPRTRSTPDLGVRRARLLLLALGQSLHEED